MIDRLATDIGNTTGIHHVQTNPTQQDSASNLKLTDADSKEAEHSGAEQQEGEHDHQAGNAGDGSELSRICFLQPTHIGKKWSDGGKVVGHRQQADQVVLVRVGSHGCSIVTHPSYKNAELLI